MGWDATNQEKQEHTRQQAVWVDRQGFKLELLGERGVLVSDREALKNTVTLRGSVVKPQICPIYGRAPLERSCFQKAN